MVRPRINTIEYFSHDVDSHTKKSMTILRSNFGNDGYAAWYILLEKLGSTENHYLDLRPDIEWQFFLSELSIEEAKTIAILDMMSCLDLIDSELWKSRIIWSECFILRQKTVYAKRKAQLPKKPFCGNNRSENAVLDAETIVSDTVMPQSKVKESKGKERSTLAQKEFCAFWSAYPKKRSKQNAQKAWLKLNPNPELQKQILAAVENAKQSKDWQKDNGQFIPYPATWLRAGGWEDEIVTKPKAVDDGFIYRV